jgi:hypothetical protein
MASLQMASEYLDSGPENRVKRYNAMFTDMKHGRNMSTLDAGLEQIETGEASAKEARQAIAELLEEGSEKSFERLYATLGAWLWRALEGRRRDDELREWFDVLRRVSAALAPKNAAYAERFRAFYDLLQMSINTSKVVSADDVTKRQHVVEILRILDAAGLRPVEKAAIAQTLGLKPANLSRVLHMMTDARLVERTSLGKSARFSLTRDGAVALAEKDVEGRQRDRPSDKSGDPLPGVVLKAPVGIEGSYLLHAIANVAHAHVEGRVTADTKVLEIRQAIENLFVRPEVPSVAPPGYAKAKRKRFFQGVNRTIVSTSKRSDQGVYVPIEPAHPSKSHSFVSGMLHTGREDSDHVE